MATTRKEYSSGKQKGNTCSSSCSNTTSTGQRRSRDEKQVPNYLKPTICSSNEAVKNVKKSGPEDASQSQRPNLHRRRSFDRPSTARVQIKELVSPGQDKPKTYRSTSISSKLTTVSKTSLERVVGKLNGMPRSLKKTPTTTPTNKKGSASSRLKKTTRSEDKNEAELIESKHDQVEEVIVKDEHQQVDADGSELLPQAEESEHQGDIVVDSAEAESVEEGKDTVAVDSTVPGEHNVTETEETDNEETPEDHTQVDEDKENDESKEEETKVEHDHVEDITKEETKTEAEEKGEDIINIQAEEEGEEKQVENKQEEEEEEKKQQVVESSQEQEENVEESKAADSGDVVEKSQAQVGNKESPTVPYNDMIEETASKLREERKNKVKALVGAFETVIDKETSNAMM